MENKDLLVKLKQTLAKGNKEKFIDWCYTTPCTNGYEYNNFHSLDIVESSITEDNDTFIEHLTKYIKDGERPLLEQFIKTTNHYNFKYYDIDEDNIETASDLYNKYEEELDADLIWDNAEKIIKDLEDYIDTNEE